ncbi:TetR/AcrR family transcriptional regulator [Massilia sp. NR 4-1]|uniref:TetR/AcrR family transcriptional regulator n=1 Tax=Massilia sp. NR 4-1 TaxID=1678028 RepID=UPI000A750AB7|nr:TetR/AcrR family transcriptional regulator [Massilia sp. NR 4-1]
MSTQITDLRQHILEVAKPLLLNKGYTAVGLTELLATAGIPKGSFYHYFDSKEGFGQALLDWYFGAYLAFLDDLLARPGKAQQRLMGFWQYWLDAQGGEDPAAKCLAVKLSAEVSDLSESMRVTLEQGTQGVIQRLTQCIAEGRTDGSLAHVKDAAQLANTLYQLWLGASLLAKVTRSRAPLESAMTGTRQLLKPPK